MSEVIHLKDNNCGVSKIINTETQYDDLSAIANITVDGLLKRNPDLLIFPQSLGINQDKIEELEVLHLSGSRNNLQECNIKTGNLMGFIGNGTTKVTITSRFARNSETKDDYFLHYLLQKVLSLNIVDMKYSADNLGEFDLLIYMFPSLLKKACAQGIVKQYQTFKQNDSNVKGSIDINRHIQKNILFNGKIAYKNRNFTIDNPITELIRHTIEYIKTKSIGEAILSNDYETIECVRIIQDATQNYSKNNLQRIISDNLKQFVHPYYTEYIPLQKLCLQILRHEKMNYSQNKNEAYGILFDGAWLWEEYLSTILTGRGLDFIHPQNKAGLYGISVYSGNKRYPDFYRGRQTSPDLRDGNFVLDAKYKHLEIIKSKEILESSFSRDDLHQLITYMHILPSDFGALIYPLDKTSGEDTRSRKRQLKGYGGQIWTIGVKIPQNCSSLKDFAIKMKTSENIIKLNLKKDIFGVGEIVL